MESSPHIIIDQLLPSWLKESNLKQIPMIYISIDKQQTQQVLKYLSKEMPLTEVPISDQEAENYAYGKYRVKEKIRNIDFSHAKRIRPSANDPNQLNILLTS
jgi:hypothetical protein